jgi:hypothetical protein
MMSGPYYVFMIACSRDGSTFQSAGEEEAACDIAAVWGEGNIDFKHMTLVILVRPRTELDYWRPHILQTQNSV